MRQTHLCLLAGFFQGKTESIIKSKIVNHRIIMSLSKREALFFLNTTAGAAFNSIFMLQISDYNLKATLQLDYCIVLFVSIPIRNVNNESIIAWMWCRWSVCRDGAPHGNCSPLLEQTFPLTSAAHSHFLNGAVLLGKEPISCSVPSTF